MPVPSAAVAFFARSEIEKIGWRSSNRIRQVIVKVINGLFLWVRAVAVYSLGIFFITRIGYVLLNFFAWTLLVTLRWNIVGIWGGLFENANTKNEWYKNFELIGSCLRFVIFYLEFSFRMIYLKSCDLTAIKFNDMTLKKVSCISINSVNKFVPYQILKCSEHINASQWFVGDNLECTVLDLTKLNFWNCTSCFVESFGHQ